VVVLLCRRSIADATPAVEAAPFGSRALQNHHARSKTLGRTQVEEAHRTLPKRPTRLFSRTGLSACGQTATCILAARSSV